MTVIFMHLPFLSIGQQYNFINYTIEDGLAQSQVTDINQDNQGYLWAGTLGGISKFDGKTFSNYSTANGLTHNQVNAVFKGNKGNLWIGALGGVTQINGASICNYKLEAESSNFNVTCFAQENNGQMYFGTDGGVVFKLNIEQEGTTTNHALPTTEKMVLAEALPSKKIRSLYMGPKNNLWIGTKKGVIVFNNKNAVAISQKLAELNVSKIIPDQDGNIWISTYGQGLLRINPQTMQVNLQLTAANGLINDWIRSMAIDKLGNVWIATKSGLNKIEGYDSNNLAQLKIKRFSTSSGLPTNNINCVSTDIEGNIWLGSNGKGLLKFTGESFASYSSKDGLSGDIVMSVLQDKESNLWFSTYGNGITKFDGEKYTYYNRSNGLSNNTVWCSLEDQQNNLWFGTSRGLVKYDKDGFHNYFISDGLSANKITAIEECKNGEIWVGCSRGISKISGSEITSFNNQNGFNWKNNRAILEDQKGNLWIGSSEGLIKYDGISFTHYSKINGLSDNTIYSLEEDKLGNIWVGTKAGLTLFDGNDFKPQIIENDFRSNIINFLKVDNNQDLWIGTNNGIYNLSLKQFYAGNSPSFQHFTNWEGVTSLETNLNGAYQDRSGKLWFCTSNSVVRHEPNMPSEGPKSTEPFINITDVGLFHETGQWEKYSKQVEKETLLPKNLTVKHNKNHFTFHYTGISFSNPSKLLYQYQLKGFEPEWMPATTAGFATYSNLPPGEYTFMVKAANKHGTWSTTPATFAFSISNPFWATWWFYSLCMGAMGILGYVVYKWRTNVNKRKAATSRLLHRSKMLVLEQKSLNANMNKHFIFNALNSIQYYINKEDKKSANDYLASFAKLIRKNLDDAHQNLVSLSEELERLELYLSLEHMRFDDKFNYEIKLDDDVDVNSIKIPAMILQPFVENSIKHGILPLNKKGEVCIRISKNENDQLVFGIEDNGIGIEQSLKKKFSGHREHVSQGMNITKNRLDLLKKITNKNFHIRGPEVIKDKDDNTLGTKVEITLPINYN